jgi:hypothetical protein
VTTTHPYFPDTQRTSPELLKKLCVQDSCPEAHNQLAKNNRKLTNAASDVQNDTPRIEPSKVAV